MHRDRRQRGAEHLSENPAESSHVAAGWSYCHPHGFRLFWHWKSRRRTGRSPTDRDLIELTVKAAIEAGQRAAAPLGKVIAVHVIARPHEDLAALLPG